MANFRPNVIVDTCEAFAEDTWDSLIFESIPPVAMNVVKPCARCKMPTIDPTNGTFDPDNQPTRTIKKFRSGKALGFQDESWSGEVTQYLNDVTALFIAGAASTVAVMILHLILSISHIIDASSRSFSAKILIIKARWEA